MPFPKKFILFFSTLNFTTYRFSVSGQQFISEFQDWPPQWKRSCQHIKKCSSNTTEKWIGFFLVFFWQYTSKIKSSLIPIRIVKITILNSDIFFSPADYFASHEVNFSRRNHKVGIRSLWDTIVKISCLFFSAPLYRTSNLNSNDLTYNSLECFVFTSSHINLLKLISFQITVILLSFILSYCIELSNWIYDYYILIPNVFLPQICDCWQLYISVDQMPMALI